MNDYIHLTGVTKSYHVGRQEVSIFADLDLVIPRGEFVAIMGPSGSGKSTLLNLLGGIDRTNQGQIKVGGVFLDKLGESALTQWRAANVGIVFQFYNLLPMLTAEENVALPLMLRPLDKRSRAQRIATVMDLVGLADRSRQYPSLMSGGQQQRVGIARAIVSDPNLILCDEPTGDLDRVSADEILTMLRFLNKEFGKTIVMVTHDEQAARYATRTLRLDKGRFVETAEVLQ